MMERNSRGQKGLGSQKGSLHDRSPGKGASAFCGICEGFEDAGNTRKERTIKIQHAQEPLQSFDIGGWGVINDWLDMRGNGRKASRSDMMAKEINFCGAKNALVRIDVEAILREDRKDLLQMRKVTVRGVTENEEVIQVDEQERERMKKGVHESLKGLGSIHEAKWHEEKFEKSERGDDRRFWNVVFIHRHLIVSFL
jgi:hypothetical protein